MVLLLEISFWITVFVLAYTYGGFSILLAVVGKILNRDVKKADIRPSMSIIIAAYNEESSIAQKLDNMLGLDYPADKLEIIVASDGSDDATNDIVSGYKHRGVNFLDRPRRGKIFALNDAVNQSTGEILVFSDANTMFMADALNKLASNFADAEVGGVCGNQKHLNERAGDNSSKGEKLYWAYDKWLKTMESRTGSIVSADGAIYAIRRSLYKMPAFTDVTDDFAISTGVVEQRYRLVFENEAYAYESASSRAGDEFWRKVRIMNRGLRGVVLRKGLLNPFKYGFYSVILFSHKVLRRLVPVFLIFLFGVTLSLSPERQFFFVMTLLQGLFYLFALFGYALRNNRLGSSKILYIPFFYCLANAAALVAITRLLRGKRIELWQPKREPVEPKLGTRKVVSS